MKLFRVVIAYVAMVMSVAFAAFGITLVLGVLADALFASLGDGTVAKLVVIVFLLVATFGISWVSWFFRKALCPCRICPWVCEE